MSAAVRLFIPLSVSASIVAVAVFPFDEVTVIVAVPSDFPVTFPVLSTVAILPLHL